MTALATAIAAPIPTATPPTPLVANGQPSSSGGLSFGDVLDAVNPLQHIPVVSSIYRAVTGSHISAASEIAGDTLYGLALPGGALMGLASSAADVAVKAVTGSGIAQHVVSAISPSSSPSQAASSQTPAAMPLVALSSGAAGANTTQSPIPAIPLGHNTQATNALYQRAQIMDSLNSRLLKMAV